MSSIEGEFEEVIKKPKLSVPSPEELAKADRDTTSLFKAKNNEPPTTPKRTKMRTRLNLTKLLDNIGTSPELILAAIASGDEVGLGLPPDVNISVKERSDAAKTLLSYIAAPCKPVEVADESEEVQIIPEFVPRRGLLTRTSKKQEEVNDEVRRAEAAEEAQE